MLLVLACARDRERYDRAVGRWLVRLQETVALPWADRERCARALATLADGRGRDTALDDLGAVLMAHGQGRAVDEVETFRGRLG
ncbi:MAG: hypothetical protein AB7R67_23680 [Vicinamibacterales bacterium]